MQLNNNRVWDYAGDNYVHRLVQNKSDGKMVEVDEGGNVVDSTEKLDSIALEVSGGGRSKMYILGRCEWGFVNMHGVSGPEPHWAQIISD